MPVVVSGQQSQALTQRLTVGSQVTVQGFVSCHQGRNGLNKLVLHAEQIELIDSGD
jgi:primosomal replication protein N